MLHKTKLVIWSDDEEELVTARVEAARLIDNYSGCVTIVYGIEDIDRPDTDDAYDARVWETFGQ